jgi:hypothetical protein
MSTQYRNGCDMPMRLFFASLSNIFPGARRCEERGNNLRRSKWKKKREQKSKHFGHNVSANLWLPRNFSNLKHFRINKVVEQIITN